MLDSGPNDRYTPAPGTAECPHCAHVVAGASVPAAGRMATFEFHCPGCGQRWLELRDRHGVGRYYLRAAVAEGYTDGR